MHLSSIIQGLLNEANILNLDVPLNGTSVHSFLAQHLKNIPVSYREMLNKKLTKLIVNDQRFHQQISQLPDGAPEWAVRAFNSGNPLVAFVPTEALADAMSHITHYVQALDQNSKKTDDPNEVAVANKEINGIPKVENLEVLIQKSNQYFTRGTKKVVHTIEGAEHVLSIAGFDWYKLITQEAYAREGKVLQNCIGSIYKAKHSNIQIYVMKTESNETVVAARGNTNNTLEEVKGKNNKPPVSRYMQGVASFINHGKWSLSSSCDRDIHAAGYCMYKDVLYSMAQMIEKFTTSTVIPFSGNTKIVSVDLTNVPTEILPFLTGTNVPDDHKSGTRNDFMYNISSQSVGALTLRTTQHEIMSFTLTEGSDLMKFAAEIEYLFKSNLLTGVTTNCRRDLKQLGIKIDELGKLVNLASPDYLNNETRDQILTHQEDKRTSTITLIKDWIHKQRDKDWLGDIKDVKLKIGQAGKEYSGSEHDTTPVEIALINRDNHATMMNLKIKNGKVEVNPNTFGPTAFSGDDSEGDKSIDDWIDTANENKWVLPTSLLISKRLVGTPGNYHTFNIKYYLSSDQDGIKCYDLQSVRGQERASVLINSIENMMDNSSITTAIKAKLNTTITKKQYDYPEHTGQLSDDNFDTWTKEVFHGFPTKIFFSGGYRNTTTPHKEKILMFVVGNKITHIINANDLASTIGTSTAKNFRTPNDQDIIAKVVSDTINKHHLIIDSTTLADNHLVLDDHNVVHTQSSKTAETIAKRHADSPLELTFKDGTVIKRAPAKDAVDFATYRKNVANHKELESPDTTVYEIMQSSSVIGAFMVKNNKLGDVWGWKKETHEKASRSRQGYSRLPSDPSSSLKLLQYVTAAADKLGFNIAKTSKNTIKPNSSMHRILTALNAADKPTARTAIIGAAGMNPQGAAGWYATKVPPDKQLVDAGFVSMEQKGASYLLSINNRGKKALEHLAGGSSVSLSIQPAAIADQDDSTDTKNDVPTDNTQKPDTTALPVSSRSGTKMGNAKEMWDKMVKDGKIPTRAEFMKLLIDELSMTKAGAGTYYQTLKVKHMKETGQLSERFSFLDFLFLVD